MQVAFDKVEVVLMHKPVLYAPNFEKPFKLAVDASDVGAGAVLLQKDDLGVEHPPPRSFKRARRITVPVKRNYWL